MDRLLEEFLKTEMDRLQRFMEGETMDRWGDHGQEGEGVIWGGGGGGTHRYGRG